MSLPVLSLSYANYAPRVIHPPVKGSGHASHLPSITRQRGSSISDSPEADLKSLLRMHLPQPTPPPTPSRAEGAVAITTCDAERDGDVAVVARQAGRTHLGEARALHRTRSTGFIDAEKGVLSFGSSQRSPSPVRPTNASGAPEAGDGGTDDGADNPWTNWIPRMRDVAEGDHVDLTLSELPQCPAAKRLIVVPKRMLANNRRRGRAAQARSQEVSTSESSKPAKKVGLKGMLKSSIGSTAGGQGALVKMLADIGAAMIQSKLVIGAFKRDENLKTLTDAQLAMLAYVGKPRTLARYAIVYREGATATSFFVLLKGKIRIASATGAVPVRIIEALPDSKFTLGTEALSGAVPRPVTATTLTDCEFLQFATEDLAMDTAGADALADRVFAASVKEALRASLLFQHLRTDLMDELAPAFSLIKVEADVALFSEGEDASCMYILLNGTLSVTVEAVVVAKLPDPERAPEGHPIFGLDALLTGKKRTTHVRSITPCQLLTITYRLLNRFFHKHPEFRKKMYEFIDAQRAQWSINNIKRNCQDTRSESIQQTLEKKARQLARERSSKEAKVSKEAATLEAERTALLRSAPSQSTELSYPPRSGPPPAADGVPVQQVGLGSVARRSLEVQKKMQTALLKAKRVAAIGGGASGGSVSDPSARG